jgi:exonuclease SbcC
MPAISRCKSACADESVQKAQAEQAKLNETSRCAASNTKKNQHYLDVELLCRQEEKIKSLEAERAQLQAGHPVRCAVQQRTRR